MEHVFVRYSYSFFTEIIFYSGSSRLLLRSTPDPCTAKNDSFQARVKCAGKNPGEQSLCQWKHIPRAQQGQPPKMHGPGLWKYGQNEQRVTPVPLSGGNCDFWCPGVGQQKSRRYRTIMGLIVIEYYKYIRC